MVWSLIVSGLLPTQLPAASVTLAWDPNTETNLAGYKLHYGPASGTYSTVRDVGNVVTATASNLTEGTYFFVVTAYDTDRLESDPSNEVAYTNRGGPPVIFALADRSVAQDSSTPALPVHVTDAETPAANLTLTASSSNPTLVPLSRITLGGSGTNRSVTIAPASNQSGTAVITLTVRDAGGSTASRSFTLTVISPNSPPTISSISNQVVAMNSSTPELPFRVGDVVTPAQNLVVTAGSSHSGLVPSSNILLGGSGSNRTVRVTPLPDRYGVVTITLTVADGTGATASTSFRFTVPAPNNLPTISGIADQNIARDSSTPTLPFLVGDAETPAASLAVTASCSNPTLVPLSRITLGGAGTNRSVQVTPAAGQSGTAVITLTVTDGGGATANESFTLTVVAPNSLPTISSIPNQTVATNTATPVLPFRVGDAETPAQNLTVTASSSHSGLVPFSNILLGGSGSNRTVQVIPVSNRFGVVTITLTVADAAGARSNTTFRFTVLAPNSLPTISSIADQEIDQDSATTALPFQVADVETPATSLTVTASSSNPTLVPVNRVVLAGSGANRTVQVAPAPGQSGTAVVTLTVTDGGGATASGSFTLTVVAPNAPPTISSITNQVVPMNGTSLVLPFRISDAETPAEELIVSAASSHSGLVPYSYIVLGGAGADRTVQVTPLVNRYGVVTITLTVTDAGGATASSSFRFAVPAP